MNSIFQKRMFCEKFSYAFNWMYINRKGVLKYYAILLLPINFLISFGTLSAMKLLGSDPIDLPLDVMKDNIGTLSIYFLLIFADLFLSISMFFALFHITEQLHKPLNETTFSYVWTQMKKNMGKTLKAGISVVLFALILMAIIMIITVLLSLIFSIAESVVMAVMMAAMMVVCVPLMAFYPLYMLNDEPLFGSFFHSLKLGFKSWWGFFSTGLVIIIMSCLIELVLGQSPRLYTSLSAIYGVGEGFGSTLVYAVCIVLDTLANFVGSALTPLSFLILTVQYGHAANKHEGTTDFGNFDLEMVAKSETENAKIEAENTHIDAENE